MKPCKGKPYATAAADNLPVLYLTWIRCSCPACNSRIELEDANLKRQGFNVIRGVHANFNATGGYWKFPGYVPVQHQALLVCNAVRAIQASERWVEKNWHRFFDYCETEERSRAEARALAHGKLRNNLAKGQIQWTKRLKVKLP